MSTRESTSQPEPLPLFMELVLGEPLERYSVQELGRATRHLLRELPPEDEAWYRPGGPPIEEVFESSWRSTRHDQGALYGRIAASFMRQDLARWRPRERALGALRKRAELLEALSHSKNRSPDRRAHASRIVSSDPNFHTGWDLRVVLGEDYQLGQQRPWWRPGPFELTEEERARLGEDAEALRAAGFQQVSRQRYIDRIQTPAIRLMVISDPRCLLECGALIALYTASRQERSELAELARKLRNSLAARVTQELDFHQTAVPMKPLYSLPREMRNLGSFYISRQIDQGRLTVQEEAGVVRSQLEHAGARVLPPGEEGAGQQVLLFDTQLVRRDKSRPDQFIEVQLDEESPSILGALIQAIHQMGVEEAALEHMPRIVAGIFNAAQRDKRLRFNVEGTFWDTRSGRRLCRIVGFNPDNPRHRKTVQDVRQLLQTIVLHREVCDIDPDGRYRRIKWSGRLLGELAEQIEIEAGDREGITERNVYQAWAIAGALWKMVIPKIEGGAPSFMSLDERAFSLDERSSLPFNIYWTLINRAYMDQLDEQGGLNVTLGTLYKWSGLEGRYERPAKLKPKVRDALERMVTHGLLDSWSCEELADECRVSMDALLASRLRVVFSASQRRTFEHLPHRQPEALEPGR